MMNYELIFAHGCNLVAPLGLFALTREGGARFKDFNDNKDIKDAPSCLRASAR